MENNNPPGIVIINLVNDDNNEDCHQENVNINNGVNDLCHQRQIEEAAEAKEDRVYEIQCLHAVEISEQMTEALVNNYVPGIVL